jgi:hypothetical protein
LNREQFKKNVYKHFRIQPAMQLYEADGKLRGSLDDAWILMAATDKSFTLRNRASDYMIELGYDSYFGFTEDPGGKVGHGTDGVLVLKAQLYMHDHELKFVATIAPGKEMRDFTPPRARKSFMDTVKARMDADELARQQAAFNAGPWWPEMKRTFDELGDAIKAFIAEIRAQHPKAIIRFHRYQGGYLLWAQGWFVTFTVKGPGLPGDAYLSITKWRGCPSVPGLRSSFITATPAGETRYHYRLAKIGEVGWVEPRKLDLALTSRDVLERLFTELFEKPNDDPAPNWNLPED